ncbi:amino acid permease 3-like [Miscanthus floridulus]|uniref:amino acid permease 3-like n=1 Tax=Miscanthus floridulus TaxID=154761 RepID=UPI0034574002
MDVVRSNLDGAKVAFYGMIQYANLVGVAIGYTIASSISMKAIRRARCFHTHGHAKPCSSSSIPYMIVFGTVQIIFSQISDFNQISWLSIVVVIMSFTYSSIGLSLSIAQTISNGGKGSLTGISIGASVTSTQKVWHSLQAFDDIAFAYSFSNILIEIQDTIKAPPPSKSKVMQKATRLSVVTTTIFYMLCGCMGYVAFGDTVSDNLLMGFGFYEPF